MIKERVVREGLVLHLCAEEVDALLALLKVENGGQAESQKSFAGQVIRETGPAAPPSSDPLLLIDTERMEVRYGKRLIALFPQELRILFFLAQRPERYFTQEAIYEGINNDYSGAIGLVNLKSPISRLRSKLPSPDLIHTRRGIGYAFRPQPHIPYRII